METLNFTKIYLLERYPVFMLSTKVILPYKELYMLAKNSHDNRGLSSALRKPELLNRYLAKILYMGQVFLAYILALGRIQIKLIITFMH